MSVLKIQMKCSIKKKNENKTASLLSVEVLNFKTNWWYHVVFDFEFFLEIYSGRNRYAYVFILSINLFKLLSNHKSSIAGYHRQSQLSQSCIRCGKKHPHIILLVLIVVCPILTIKAWLFFSLTSQPTTQTRDTSGWWVSTG